jgi:hypothetical protein
MLTIKISLLMGDFGSMQEDAVLNDPTHLISGIGLPLARHVVVVAIYRSDAPNRTSAHGARSLQAPVDSVVRKIYRQRVLRAVKGEYADRRVHAIPFSVHAL